MNKPNTTSPSFGRGYTVYLMSLLLLAYTLSFVDRQILSLLVEPMKRDLAISDTQMSLLQGLSFALFYTILGLPLGRMADSYSRRKLIAGGIFLWSLMTVICGTAKSYGHLFLARMGVGVGEASLSPAAYSLISDSVKPKFLATAMGIYTMGIYLGCGLALIVGGYIVSWAATVNSISLPLIGQLYSWQLVFLCVGLPGLVVAPLFFTLKEPARRHANGSKAHVTPVRDVLSYFKQHYQTLSLCTLGAAFASFAGYGTLTWVPSFLIRSHGMQSHEVGLAFGLIVLLCGSTGVISGGLIADRWFKNGCFDAKIRVAMLAGACGLLPTIAYPLMPNIAAVLTLLAIATFCSNFMMGLGPAAIQESVPAAMRGQFSAAYLFVVNMIGLGLGPTAIALCTDYVFKDSVLVKYSIAIVPSSAILVSTILLWRCLKHYKLTFHQLQSPND